MGGAERPEKCHLSGFVFVYTGKNVGNTYKRNSDQKHTIYVRFLAVNGLHHSHHNRYDYCFLLSQWKSFQIRKASEAAGTISVRQ
jgi:hypothetical protein